MRPIRIHPALAAALCCATALFFAAATPATAPAVKVEFLDAARQIESTVMSGDAEAIAKWFDTDALMNKSTAGVPTSKQFHDGFVLGYRRGGGVGAQLADIHKNRGSYRLLRVSMQGADVHALFRVVLANGGLNYQDWTLVRQPDGTIRGVDIYTAANGETISATTRRIYVTAAAQNDVGVVGRIMGADRAYIDHGKDITTMAEDFRGKKYSETLAIYDRMPDSLRHEKTFFIIRLAALSQLRKERPADYQSAIQEYAKLFAGDPSVDLICLDGWLTAKDFAACYAALDRLDKWTGGDPMLLVNRAEVTLNEGKPDAGEQAEKLARRAVDAESRLILPHVVLIEAIARQGRYEDAVVELRDEEKRTAGPLKLEAIASLKEFVNSEPYEAYRAEKPAAAP